MCLRHALDLKATTVATDQIPTTLPRTQTTSRSEVRHDVLVIGAGPTGLACGIEVQRAGFKALVIDKGCVVNSLYNYPANMTFFTTPELLEIGDIPFSTARQKPTREEALEYYRKVVEHYRLPVVQYQRVETVDGSNGRFQVTADRRSGPNLRLQSAQADRSHRLLRPGKPVEHSRRGLAQGISLLPRAASLLRQRRAHHRRQKFGRHLGARSLAARGAGDSGTSRAKMHHHVKYWILPDIENRIKNGDIKAYFN